MSIDLILENLRIRIKSLFTL